jgi:hypothetical protein
LKSGAYSLYVSIFKQPSNAAARVFSAASVESGRPMKIESYRFGEMVIDGKRFTRDLKIIKGAVQENWWRSQGHRVQLSDISDIISAGPRILVIGTGASGLMRLQQGLPEQLSARGIRLEAVPTEHAVVVFNELLSKNGAEAVTAAFHLTC